MKWSAESVIKQLKEEWSWVSGWWEYEGSSTATDLLRVAAGGLIFAVVVVACLLFWG